MFFQLNLYLNIILMILKILEEGKMKRKFILKKASILIVIALMISSIVATAEMTNEQNKVDKRIMGLGGESTYQPIPQHKYNINSFGSIFFQPPYLANVSNYYWGAPISDLYEAGGWLVYEDFHDLTVPICDIHWWGLAGKTPNEPGDPTGMTFNITFYEYGPYPGAEVCSLTNVTPTIIPTGIEYYYEPTNETWKLYYFTDVELDPCCTLTEGWVSIYCISYLELGVGFGWEPSPVGNNFGWQYSIEDKQWWRTRDFSLVLTDGEPANPDLECEGQLTWKKVIPGENVTGSFKVRNNGDPGSILNWNISEYPSDWGSNWTFMPKASVLTPDMGWITVVVNVTAPMDKNKKFTGALKVVDSVNPTDSCQIDILLKNPKNAPIAFNLYVINWLLKTFPNALPVLRYLFT